jgi:hypothetical protein
MWRLQTSVTHRACIVTIDSLFTSLVGVENRGRMQPRRVHDAVAVTENGVEYARRAICDSCEVHSLQYLSMLTLKWSGLLEAATEPEQVPIMTSIW